MLKGGESPTLESPVLRFILHNYACSIVSGVVNRRALKAIRVRTEAS